ncbi:hypothetical protein EVAR_99_1 [Eumeta japonica]|uniref:Uncharacterized protein n=1 Tax=Eumeta variegata TaxID=151549 RepID=A0A4C1SBL9_EUMVA|nr:hypothetical protein EVAR_99_1 [Eumeta japonica]
MLSSVIVVEGCASRRQPASISMLNAYLTGRSAVHRAMSPVPRHRAYTLGGRKTGQIRQDYYFFGLFLMSSRYAPSAPFQHIHTYMPVSSKTRGRPRSRERARERERRVTALVPTTGRPSEAARAAARRGLPEGRGR